MKIEIRQVTEYDAEELLRIYAPYVKETAVSFEYDVPSLEEFTERIRTVSAGYPYLKAVCDGRTVGYAYAARFKERKAYERTVEVSIYVLRDFRRNGVGSTLYKALEASLIDRGVLNMNACIAMPKDSDPYLTMDSCLFHKSAGFSYVGMFHDCAYKFGRWYNMIWMEKMIGDHR